MKTAKIACLRDVAIATNFGTKLAVNGLRRGDNDVGFSYKGRFVFSQPLHLLVALSGFVLRQSELL